MQDCPIYDAATERMWLEEDPVTWHFRSRYRRCAAGILEKETAHSVFTDNRGHGRREWHLNS